MASGFDIGRMGASLIQGAGNLIFGDSNNPSGNSGEFANFGAARASAQRAIDAENKRKRTEKEKAEAAGIKAVRDSLVAGAKSKGRNASIFTNQTRPSLVQGKI